MAANARLARYASSQSTNPDFSMSQLGDAFSLGETAAYIIALGDRDDATVAKDWVEYLFGEYFHAQEMNHAVPLFHCPSICTLDEVCISWLTCTSPTGLQRTSVCLWNLAGLAPTSSLTLMSWRI
jgi:hypothetical protein